MAAAAAGMTGDVGSSAHDAATIRLRSVCLGALVAIPGLPLALAALLPASTALPVGAALAVSGTLLAGAAAIGRRPDAPSPSAPLDSAAPPAAEASPYDLFAGLVTLHDMRGHVTAVHGRDREAILGWMRSPLGRGFLDQIHVSDRLGFLAAVDSLRQGGSHVTVDLRIERRRTGAEAEQFVHMRTDLTACPGADGLPAAIVAQSRDISDEATLRSESARKTAEAESANDAKTRFLAAVSHELRTPLNAIVGFSDMLAHEMAGPFTDQRQRDYSGLIRDAGCHLLEVVNSILDASKIEAGAYPIRPETVRFGDIAASSHAMLALLADRKRLTFSNEVGDAAGELICDRRAVQQILINLLSNAIKFTPEDGSVSLSARRFGRRLVIDVADSGIGIADHDLERLGRPFAQIENDYTRRCEGTGLGLSIASALVKLHDGTLSIASSPGEGTIVTVTLPVDGPRNMPVTKMTMETEGRSDVAFRKSA